MVGNFTYGPNIDGATWFADAVLPHLPEPWTLELVGPGSATFSSLARVVGHGAVDDVTEHYEACDVVVAPVLAGSGTRVKVLEAFAHRRPLVATTIAVDGLGVLPETHALIADDPISFARAVSRCGSDDLARPLVDAAARLVADTYDRAKIQGRAAELLAGATREPPTDRRQPAEDASS
jgi:glycosyltransferase involved in cell wall biosynthesis